jgi:SprT-like family
MKHAPHVNAPVTTVEYSAFQAAYNFFNTALFDGTLPHVYVTLQRKAHSRGYFSADRFTGRQRSGTVHELALNPDDFGRTDAEVLSTLVHEMVHVWQQEYGHPGRGRYHNREWAAKMLDIGLYPSTTGKKGGAMTGQRVTHYIVADGPFAHATTRLLATGFTLHWQSGIDGRSRAGRQRAVKAASKTKFTCHECGLNAWAKPDASLVCGACYEESRAIVALDPIPPA